MSAGQRNVFYVKYLSDNVFLDILGADPMISVTKLENDTPAAKADPVMELAHAYQVGASRDELAEHFHVSTELLAKCPNLLVVSSNGAGYDTVDVDACTKAGVLVVNQAGGNANAVAEHALGMILTLSKRVPQVDKALRRNFPIDRTAYKGFEARDKTIGIIGFGHVGSRLGAMCRAALDMKVLAYDPYLTAEEIAAKGGTKVDLDELLATSDFVSINCPLTKENRGMIGEAQFAKMQPHAIFVTTARGFIHDEKALEDALRSGTIAGAGLDVWMKEPPLPHHPLLQLDNVFASPHTAGVTYEARYNMGKIAAEQLIATLNGEKPPRLINPEVWPVFLERREKILGAS